MLACRCVANLGGILATQLRKLWKPPSEAGDSLGDTHAKLRWRGHSKVSQLLLGRIWPLPAFCLPSACLLACLRRLQNLNWEICWLRILGNIIPRLPTFQIQGRAEKGSASQRTADRQYSREKKKGGGQGLLGF